MESLSFVIQGPIIAKTNLNEGIYSTADVLQSIRKYYPEAEIILSTWKDSNLTGLTYDQLVLSDDPGGFALGGLTMNYNRLILSTKAGLEKATGKYVVKSRSDIIFVKDSLKNHIRFITPINSKYSVFDNYVLSTIFYVRNPIKLNLVFHPSDIFLMGTKQDVLSHFNVPLPEREFYFNEDNSTKIVSEQYFLVHNIQKKKNITYTIPKWGYINLSYFLDSEKYIFNNFRFFDVTELGIEFPKRLYSVYRPKSNYSLTQAKRLSKVYQGQVFYAPLVKLYRGALYFMYQHILYYPKLAFHNVIYPAISRVIWGIKNNLFKTYRKAI